MRVAGGRRAVVGAAGEGFSGGKTSEQILISKIERDRIHCSGDALLRELVPAASCAFVNVYTVWAQVGTFPATMRWSNRQFVVR